MPSLKTSAILLLAITLDTVSAIAHPAAFTNTTITLGATYTSVGRRFKIWAPGPTDCWIPLTVPRTGDAAIGHVEYTATSYRLSHSTVLAFHGRGGSMDRMEGVSRFHLPQYSQPPNTRCSIVLYPEGLTSQDGERAWQPAPYSNPLADDRQFVRDMLSWVTTTYAEHSSARHVYASGKSNGAALVAWLACTLADRITAFAPVSGPMYLAADLTHPDPTCAPPRAVPIIEFHGTDDTKAPYCHYRTEWNDGKISTVISWVRWWASKNRCRLSPTRTAPPTAIQTIGLLRTEIETYSSCDAGVEVTHYKIVHGLHDWPSLSRTDDSDDDESNPSLWNPTMPGWGVWSPGTVEATEIIMGFFRRFSLA